MRMASDEIKLCPQIYRYLRYEMPDCANISLIVNNLMAFGGMSQSQARNALRWGSDPYVYAEDPRNHRCANGHGHAKCCFDSAAFLNDIFVNLKDYNRFTAGSGMGFTASGLRVPIVGVALLHALCHWGNFQNGIRESGEEGFRFERATYGRVIG